MVQDPPILSRLHKHLQSEVTAMVQSPVLPHIQALFAINLLTVCELYCLHLDSIPPVILAQRSAMLSPSSCRHVLMPFMRPGCLDMATLCETTAALATWSSEP